MLLTNLTPHIFVNIYYLDCSSFLINLIFPCNNLVHFVFALFSSLCLSLSYNSLQNACAAHIGTNFFLGRIIMMKRKSMGKNIHKATLLLCLCLCSCSQKKFYTPFFFFFTSWVSNCPIGYHFYRQEKKKKKEKGER